MEMIIDFPGGARVDAHFGPYTLATDQAPPMGRGTAPAPFSLFLASLGTCAGIYVSSFCMQRGIPTDGVRIMQRMHTNPATHMVDNVTLEIQVPPDFPEKYHKALIRAADQCAVKKHFENPPTFEIFTQTVEMAG